MSEYIRVSRADGVLTIAIDRPEKKNALTAPMYERMIAALDEAAGDGSIGAVMFCGADGVFTAGNDIADFLADYKDIAEFAGLRFVCRVAAFDKPVVAAVDGVAMGVGTTMLFHCDLVYASPRAKFRMPFIDLALVPEAGSSLLVPLRVGMAKATEFLLLGDAFDAAEGKALGIVNAIVEAGGLTAHAHAAAARLAAKPREALAASRRLMRGDRKELLARMDEESREFGKRMVSDEARQVFMAFMSKPKK